MKQWHWATRWGWMWLGTMVLALLVMAQAVPLKAANQAESAEQDTATTRFLPLIYSGDAPLCRIGVNGAPGRYPVQPLRLGWYLDYTASRIPNGPPGMDYYPMIRLKQVGATYDYAVRPGQFATADADLIAVLEAHPGTYWFIGNEPDRIGLQDNLEPEVYAEVYHDLYHRIKSRDPAAKIVAGTIVQPTPVRLLYLDRVLDSYASRYGEPMPVDVWAFHNFILNEASCAQHNNDIFQCWGAEIPPGIDWKDGLRIDVQDNDNIDLFKQQVFAFRHWMEQRGYQNVPAFLSEFGVLMPQGLFNPDFAPDRVSAFMNATFDFLLAETDEAIGYPADGYRLVQRFAWYSVDDRVYNGALFRPAGPETPLAATRTPIGDNLAAYTRAIAPEVELAPLRVGLAQTVPQGPGIALEATVANRGNLVRKSLAEVRFYDGDPATGGRLIGAPVQIALGGCGQLQTAQVVWPEAPSGVQAIYVQVEPNESVAERDRSDNLIRVEVHLP